MLLERIQSASETAPDRVAVVASDERLTFVELSRRSERVAMALALAGVESGAVVTFYGRRSSWALVAMLGIMRAGAAYAVVEDDGLPEENRGRLLATRPDFVLCDESELGPLRALGLLAHGVRTLSEGALPARLPVVRAEDSAYVLYTSGSTGTPKGVAVSHGNIAHYTASLVARLQIEPFLRYAHVSTLAADLGNTSLFLSLCTRGCLHLVDRDTRKDPGALRGYLSAHAIDFLKITPSHWNAIFSEQAEPRPRLRYLVLGGEALPVTLARRILASGWVERLVNHYGPTETTVGVTVFPIESVQQLDALASPTVPIGLPLGDTILRVRTEDGTFAERGARGELYIGGPSVAIGYVGDMLNTERSFVSIDGGASP